MLELFHHMVAHCGPERLHPYSEMLMMAFLNGKVEAFHFVKWFHMPNSDYLGVPQCVIHLTQNLALPLTG